MFIFLPRGTPSLLPRRPRPAWGGPGPLVSLVSFVLSVGWSFHLADGWLRSRPPTSLTVPLCGLGASFPADRGRRGEARPAIFLLTRHFVSGVPDPGLGSLTLTLPETLRGVVLHLADGWLLAPSSHLANHPTTESLLPLVESLHFDISLCRPGNLELGARASPTLTHAWHFLCLYDLRYRWENPPTV